MADNTLKKLTIDGKEVQVQSAIRDSNGNIINTTYAPAAALDNKQDTLVSGTNIKTINNTSLLGSGNIPISGGETSTTITATLSASSWTGSSVPYSITFAVSGVTSTSNNFVSASSSITAAQLTALQSANLQDGGQSTNSITLKAYGTKPTIDLPIRITIYK